jgi:DnaK suppressor protein
MTSKKTAKKPASKTSKKPAPKKALKKAAKPAPKKAAKVAAKPISKAPLKAAAKAPAKAAKPIPVRIPVRVMMPKVAPFTRPAALQSNNGNGPRPIPSFKPGIKNGKAKPVVAIASMVPAGPKTVAKPPIKPAAAPKRVNVSTAVGLPAGMKPYRARKDEPYMNEPQREHFTKILLAWKRSLMEEVDRTVHHMQDEAANFPDPNDRATQESEFSLELRTRDRERKLIKKIDEAIVNITQDEYGYCEDCGAEIGVQRLEARPTATQCIDCKTLDEIREKQMGG